MTEPAGRRRRRVRRPPQRFYDRLDGVRELLTDGRRASVRLVVNPERMVIAEARRTYTYLSLFGYHVDAVVANRLLPDEVSDPWFARWKAAHAEHLATIEEGFAPRAGAAGRRCAGRAGRRSTRCAASPTPSTATRIPTARFCTPASRCGCAAAGDDMRARARPAVRRPRRPRARPRAATSCSCGSARTAGRSCCPTPCAAGRWRPPACADGRLTVTFGGAAPSVDEPAAVAGAAAAPGVATAAEPVR